MNFYKILQIPRKATANEVRKAYHRMALKWHPDKNTNKELSGKKFRAVYEAYKTLSDDKKRRTYDIMSRIPIPTPYNKKNTNSSMPKQDKKNSNGDLPKTDEKNPKKPKTGKQSSKNGPKKRGPKPSGPKPDLSAGLNRQSSEKANKLFRSDISGPKSDSAGLSDQSSENATQKTTKKSAKTSIPKETKRKCGAAKFGEKSRSYNHGRYYDISNVLKNRYFKAFLEETEINSNFGHMGVWVVLMINGRSTKVEKVIRNGKQTVKIYENNVLRSKIVLP